MSYWKPTGPRKRVERAKSPTVRLDPLPEHQGEKGFDKGSTAGFVRIFCALALIAAYLYLMVVVVVYLLTDLYLGP